MNARKAITRADNLRMNALGEEQKYAWLYELDGKLAETLGVDIPENPFPDDGELLMPAPCDNIYELYLVAMIDYFNQETTLYANDMIIFNNALDEAKAWWIRNHRPTENRQWRVM